MEATIDDTRWLAEALEALAAEYGAAPAAPSGEDLDALARAIGE
jgi:hypothetical protein